MTVIFHNPGEIDFRTVTTFGVNIKPNTESPIGTFGTGLKYAAAVLLRTGHKITIQSGEREVKLTSLPVPIRGQAFNVVLLDGKELGFTTELGKDWEVWMAYRELYSNALDEGGGVEIGQSPRPTPGATRIIVEGDGMDEAAAQHSLHFLDRDTPIINTPDLHVHLGKSSYLYYRSVRVGRLPKPSLYTYNIRAKLALTEDRTVRDHYAAESHIETFYQKYCENAHMLREVLLATDIAYEARLCFTYGEYSPLFMDVVQELSRRQSAVMNHSALQAVKARREIIAPDVLPLSPMEQGMLDVALEFLNDIGFPIEDEIHCVRSLGKGILGAVRDGEIYVSQETFIKGTKQLTATILEEGLHKDSGYMDCSRGMQDHLLELTITFAERYLGKAL